MAIKNPSSPATPPPPAPAMPQLVFLASPAELGRAVRAARLARRLTQEDVAERAKVSRKFVNQVEEGKAGAHLGKVLTLMMTVGLVGMVVPVEAMQSAMG
jgi:DNA-binding XRE family transcriptional regulator